MFLGLYLEALDEELVTLRSSIGTHRPASTLKVKELEEEAHSSESQTEMRERDYTVRRFLFTGLGVADIHIQHMDTKRQVQSSHPSRAYSVEGPV